MTKKPRRIQHKFWLDINRDTEAGLNDMVLDLKQRRAFSATVRDGFRLMADLRAGRVDVLIELFPFVRGEFSDGGAGGGGELQAQINRLEKALLSQDNGAIMAPVAGPRPMALAPVAGPVYDDDDDIPLVVIMKAATDGKISGANFLRSAFNLQR